MKIIVSILLTLALGAGLSHKSNGQQNKAATPKYLDIGDTLPDLPLGQLINYPGREKSLGDFKGKLLILDFWATWCSPCVGAFPANDKLRQTFGDQIAILPVTYEDAAKAQLMLTNIERDKMTNKLFSIVNDKSIRSLFNFKTIPHYVWIDKTGKIVSQTTHNELTPEKIQAVLNGNSKVLVAKGKVIRRRESGSQLFKIGANLKGDKGSYIEPIPDSSIFFRSALIKSIEGLASSQSFRPHRFTAANTTVQWLYKLVLGKVFMKQRHEFAMYMADNRVIWELRDSVLNIIVHGKGVPETTLEFIEWEKKHGYCYEIVTPDFVSEKEMYQIALEDLNRHFKLLYGIVGTVEKRRVKCLVLERTSNVDKLHLEDKVVKAGGSEGKYGFKITNTRFDFFLQRFASYYFQHIPTPLVDETGIDPLSRVSMNIECNLADVWAVNKELAKYDLQLREDYRDIDMVIIKQVGEPKLKLP